jgi:hypothetical protein
MRSATYLGKSPALCTVHCPKRLVNFVTDNLGRWAPVINNENFRQAHSAFVIGNEILKIFWTPYSAAVYTVSPMTMFANANFFLTQIFSVC